MPLETAVAKRWVQGNVYALILSALEKTGKGTHDLTVEDLAPVDHFHARGFLATVELADRLPVTSESNLLDIGCGLGGPARYFAQRFKCKVSGIDIAPGFVEAANKLTALLGMEQQVTIVHGDGEHLPYPDGTFDGAYSQHVTMNVGDRGQFFSEAFRVLKPGAFFALSEHGLGPTGNPHHPLPWSEDGSGAFLVTPAETRKLLEGVGFEHIAVEETGPKYLVSYKQMIERASHGGLPPFGMHILIGEGAPQKLRNAARNIEQGRTRPVQVFCRKPP